MLNNVCWCVHVCMCLSRAQARADVSFLIVWRKLRNEAVTHQIYLVRYIYLFIRVRNWFRSLRPRSASVQLLYEVSLALQLYIKRDHPYLISFFCTANKIHFFSFCLLHQWKSFHIKIAQEHNLSPKTDTDRSKYEKYKAKSTYFFAFNAGNYIRKRISTLFNDLMNRSFVSQFLSVKIVYCHE